VTYGEPTPSGNAATPVRRGWLGIIAVLLGATLMIGGITAVWLYARRLPARTATVSAAGAAPPSMPIPSPPELAAPEPEDSALPAPTASAPARPKLVLPVAITPFPDDASAPVPVLGGHPLWGGRDAFVTVTVFADLENAESIALLREILPLKAQLGAELRVMYRSLPASDHAAARVAARALAEIHATRGEQAFWHALAAIVRRGDPLGPGLLESVLDDAGLPGYPLPSPNARAEAGLADDIELATLLYVRETPTSFVNGARLTGFVPRVALGEIVERERRAAYLALAGGTPPAAVYTERTRKNLLNLGADPPGRACVPDGDSPALGAPGALVTVVEFSDLECELCHQGDAALAAVRKARPNDLRVVWKNFPLPQHHRARLAANVAFAARRFGGDTAFWAVMRALLDPGATLDEEGLTRAVARAGLDGSQILSAAHDGTFDASIDTDVKLAESLGISGAPTYFVNGQKVDGALSEPELRALVDKELALGRRVRTQGAGAVSELACGVRAASRR
jgi:protein-disulfide isomerase